VATALTLILPLWFLTRTFTDAQGNAVAGWKLFWTVFGSSNQLLAAMVLFGLSVWLFKLRMKFRVALLPSLFMILIAISSLFLITRPWLTKILHGEIKLDPVGITCLALFILTGFLILEGMKIFFKEPKPSLKPPSLKPKELLD